MSERTGTSWRSAALIGATGFALVLLLSAFLKSRSPDEAATAINWTGLERGSRLVLTDGLSVGEAVVGALLLVVGGARFVQLAGVLLAGMLLVGHALGMESRSTTADKGSTPATGLLTYRVVLPGSLGDRSSPLFAVW